MSKRQRAPVKNSYKRDKAAEERAARRVLVTLTEVPVLICSRRNRARPMPVMSNTTRRSSRHAERICGVQPLGRKSVGDGRFRQSHSALKNITQYTLKTTGRGCSYLRFKPHICDAGDKDSFARPLQMEWKWTRRPDGLGQVSHDQYVAL